MQETIELIVPAGFPEKRSAGELQQLLETNYEQLHELLMSYHFRDRNSVSDIRVREDSVLFTDAGSGSFVIKYVIGIFNGCADLNFTDRREMKIQFKFGVASSSIVLTGEYIPERGQDEI